MLPQSLPLTLLLTLQSIEILQAFVLAHFLDFSLSLHSGVAFLLRSTAREQKCEAGNNQNPYAAPPVFSSAGTGRVMFS